MKQKFYRSLRAAIALVFLIGPALPAAAAPIKVYLAPDDHTDYIWSATEAEYKTYFLDMLDYYLNAADSTAGEVSQYQSRFTTDGTFWFWTYEKNRTAAQFQRLMDRFKDGHISSPMTPLTIVWGGSTTEGALRALLYAGRLERRFNVRFSLAQAMENQTMPLGIGSLWAGSGVKYIWHGVCNCATSVTGLSNRDREIYYWLGKDGSKLLMKWFSINTNDSIGGYAEARNPSAAVDYVTTNAAFNGFSARYPYNIVGVFGQGWDDRETLNLNIQAAAKAKTDSTRNVIVSNEEDFFKDFEATNGASLQNYTASFGNEWDAAPVSLAESSARVKRAVEKLRAAEAMATLVSLQNPGFMSGRETARDLAMMDLGLYYEHDFGNGGPGATGTERLAFQRRLVGEIETYVNKLHSDAAAALAGMIQSSGSNARFYVFNPLGWVRTDAADVAYSGAWPAQVIDLTTGQETPSQLVTVNGLTYIRVLARNVPSVGYKVFEIQAGAGQTFANAPTADAGTGVMSNDFYTVTVAARGAITSLVDKARSNRQFAATVGGKVLNDLGSGSGSLSVENAGTVSATILANATSPLAHKTRVTVYREVPRVDIVNEVTQNFGDASTYWSFGYNLSSPEIRHEEVGAILLAKLVSQGGDYSPRNARYDLLTLNHFGDVSQSGGPGITLSNADCYMMRAGNSSISTLDSATPQISPLLGGALIYIPSQGGDTYFMQRFSLWTHDAFDAAASMRFALEHQNPMPAFLLTGSGSLPATSYSLLTISDPHVLLWALKPADDGISSGVIARVWNLSSSPVNASLNFERVVLSAARTTHIETDISSLSPSGTSVALSPAQQQLMTVRVQLGASAGTGPTPPSAPRNLRTR